MATEPTSSSPKANDRIERMAIAMQEVDRLASDRRAHEDLHWYREMAIAADRVNGVEIIPTGYQLAPIDTGPNFSDSSLPFAMISAGMDTLERADDDLADRNGDDVPDWDNGMIAVAVYRAMLGAMPEITPAETGAVDELANRIWDALMAGGGSSHSRITGILKAHPAFANRHTQAAEALRQELAEANADRCYHDGQDTACKLEGQFIVQLERADARAAAARAECDRIRLDGEQERNEILKALDAVVEEIAAAASRLEDEGQDGATFGAAFRNLLVACESSVRIIIEARSPKLKTEIDQ